MYRNGTADVQPPLASSPLVFSRKYLPAKAIRRLHGNQTGLGSLFALAVMFGFVQGYQSIEPDIMGAVSILINKISDPGQREAVEQAVLGALSGRTGEWTVSLLESRDHDREWAIVILGPGGAKRTWTFTGDTREPSIVRATLERDIGQTMLPMGWRTTS